MLPYKIQKYIRILKDRCQRFKRGYSDNDVYDFSNWLIEITPKMLRHLKKYKHGYPLIDDNGDLLGSGPFIHMIDSNESYEQRWDDVLEQMIIFAEEAGEETCSMKNPFEDAWWQYHEAFDKKYPKKDVLKTEEELQKEKEEHVYVHISPARDPQTGEEYEQLSRKMLDYDRRISEYRNDCKDQFFEMLKKYFWQIGD